jgi:anti-sigma B factor antagonist
VLWITVLNLFPNLIANPNSSDNEIDENFWMFKIMTTTTRTLNTLVLSGIFDRTQIPQFSQAIGRFLDAKTHHIVLDFTAVTFMDSSGLGALIVALKRVSALGGKLSLCGLRAEVKMLLELSDVEHLFDISASPIEVAD